MVVVINAEHFFMEAVMVDYTYNYPADEKCVRLRYKHVVSALLLRPWLGAPLALWLFGSVLYYWWLVSRISGLEDQNQVVRKQLRLSEKLVRVLAGDSKEEARKYQVPVLPDEEGSLCETIHVAIVCMNKCARTVMPMLKSLLYHRQNPLHFHIIVDAVSERTTDTLFETWDLPDVEYTGYNARGRMSLVEWIPNSHYSGVYTLVKLLLADVLPTSVRRVIVLDADLTFASDVRELWDMFRNMSGDQYIGMVENESNWYLGGGRWPALGRGYNTGVVLLQLARMRALGWTRLWTDAVRENLIRLKKTMLGDQDIVNAIVKKYPHIVYNISCQYNVQMSTQTFAKTCYGEDFKNVKVIHWNSPSKYRIKLRDADYFRSVHRTFVDMDGNLLREKLHRCRPETVAVKVNESEPCHLFRAAQHTKLRTLLHHTGGDDTPPDEWDVTLVLQLSTDRLQFVERLVEYWEGPLSAAIYLTDYEVTEFESFINDWSDTLSSRRNIGYHLVFKQDSMPYPVNYLRNVALRSASTPYVLLMDADFVPMRGLYAHLKRALQLTNPAPQKKVLVVAAFESQRYRVQPPRSKAALLARLGGRGDVAPFRAREWPAGHRATDYARWANATAPYEVEWQTDYEPYLVAHRSIPAYDTRFSGFGWNKVSHSVELRATGYRPLVLPGAFVVHAPHAPSPDITKFRGSRHYRTCLALLKQEFMEDLRRKYNVSWDEPPVLSPAKEGNEGYVLRGNNG